MAEGVTMDRRTSRGAAGTAFRPLTKEDIDRRIERVLDELASAGERVGSDTGDEGPWPRRITSRDLVERVRPFLSGN